MALRGGAPAATEERPGSRRRADRTRPGSPRPGPGTGGRAPLRGRTPPSSHAGEADGPASPPLREKTGRRPHRRNPLPTAAGTAAPARRSRPIRHRKWADRSGPGGARDGAGVPGGDSFLRIARTFAVTGRTADLLVVERAMRLDEWRCSDPCDALATFLHEAVRRAKAGHPLAAVPALAAVPGRDKRLPLGDCWLDGPGLRPAAPFSPLRQEGARRRGPQPPPMSLPRPVHGSAARAPPLHRAASSPALAADGPWRQVHAHRTSGASRSGAAPARPLSSKATHAGAAWAATAGTGHRSVAVPPPPPPPAVRGVSAPVAKPPLPAVAGRDRSRRPVSPIRPAPGGAGPPPLSFTTYFHPVPVSQLKRLRGSLSAGSQRVLTVPNAGGASENSEAISFEMLRALFDARLVATELEVQYVPVEAKKVDFLAEVDGQLVGVSVTRAMVYRAPEFTRRDARVLLTKKLAGLRVSRMHASPQHKWTRAILHMWAQTPAIAALMAREFETAPPALRGATILMLSVARHMDHVIFKNSADFEAPSV